MRIRMVCPAPAGTLYGNRISAVRWARILRELGHPVEITTSPIAAECDGLIALHAKRSAPAVFNFRRQYPGRPIIVALTGTDLYRDLRSSKTAQKAIEIAEHLVALQPMARDQLPRHLRAKVRVIYQSAEPAPKNVPRPRKQFRVCVVGHLRRIKDPFRAALASRDLPSESRIRIICAGAPMDARMGQLARAEERRNPRYRWLGEIPHWKVRRLIASSHLLVLSSVMEGGANVISEALVNGTPVLASRIPGSIGLLGQDYPGFYPPGDTAALRSLLEAAEEQGGFYRSLQSRCQTLAPLFRPERERSAWRELIRYL